MHIITVSQGMRFRLINFMYFTTVISRELFGAGSLLDESCKEYFCKVTGQKKWFRKLPTQKKIHDENSCTFLADSSEGKRAKQKQCVLCVLHTADSRLWLVQKRKQPWKPLEFSEILHILWLCYSVQKSNYANHQPFLNSASGPLKNYGRL